jgi:TetR/AcrR family transcriptional repressor of nem operon
MKPTGLSTVATSPDQVIAASRSGKGQFYHYFGSKEGLVHAVLEDHLQAIKSGSAPINYEIKTWQDLERWFLAQVELQRSYRMTRGCPFGTIGNEVTEKDELIRRDLSLIFEVMKNKLAAFFLVERAKGRLAPDTSEERLGDFCLAAIQGAMLVGKITRNSQAAEASVREALAHLERYAVAPGVAER